MWSLMRPVGSLEGAQGVVFSQALAEVWEALVGSLISNNDIDLTYIRVKNYIFGILGDLADFAYSPLGPMSTPADFMYTGIQDSPNTAPTIEIVNQNASQLVEQCRFSVEWYMFTTGQHSQPEIWM